MIIPNIWKVKKIMFQTSNQVSKSFDLFHVSEMPPLDTIGYWKWLTMAGTCPADLTEDQVLVDTSD